MNIRLNVHKHDMSYFKGKRYMLSANIYKDRSKYAPICVHRQVLTLDPHADENGSGVATSREESYNKFLISSSIKYVYAQYLNGYMVMS